MADFDITLDAQQIEDALLKVHNADTTPTASSSKTVTSGGIYTAFQDASNTIVWSDPIRPATLEEYSDSHVITGNFRLKEIKLKITSGSDTTDSAWTLHFQWGTMFAATDLKATWDVVDASGFIGDEGTLGTLGSGGTVVDLSGLDTLYTVPAGRDVVRLYITADNTPELRGFYVKYVLD